MSSIEEILKKIEEKKLQKLLDEIHIEQEKFDAYEKQRQFMINGWKIYENIHSTTSNVTSAGGSKCKNGCLEFGYQDNNLRYLTVSANTDFNIGENDFTVEWFQYQIGDSGYPRVFQFGGWPDSPFGVSVEGSTFYFWVDTLMGPNSISVTIPDVLNKWTYFVISRISGITRIYLDGQMILETSFSYTINPNGLNMYIGIDPDYLSTTYFTGGITNFHIVNGTGLYTTETISVPRHIQKVDNTIILLSVIDESNFLTDSSGTDKILINGGESPVIWNPSNPCGEFTSLIP